MKVVRFLEKGHTGFGLIDSTGKKVFSSDALFEITKYEDFISFLDDIENKKLRLEFNIEELELLAPIIPTKNVMCIGKNYYDHILEFDGSMEDVEKVKENPIFFSKSISSIIGPNDNIYSHPDLTSELDYEAELGVIIGKECLNVSKEEALEYIFGYTIINDVTARDLQKKHQQWLKGKSLDTFCPIGPWIVTSDEIKDPNNLNISLKVNGELRQDANTKLMIHDIAKQISVLSQGMTLNPGDVIATGTPQGVGMGFKPPKFLKASDVVEISIEKIGILKNKIV